MVVVELPRVDRCGAFGPQRDVTRAVGNGIAFPEEYARARILAEPDVDAGFAVEFRRHLDIHAISHVEPVERAHVADLDYPPRRDQCARRLHHQLDHPGHRHDRRRLAHVGGGRLAEEGVVA